jgi:hypothetical protein
MIKSININENQSVAFNSNNGWFYVYQEQFGHDVLVDILPAIEAGMDAAMKLYATSDMEKMKTRKVADVLAALDEGAVADSFITLSGMQLTTFFNVAWAMAKNADPKVEDPRKWLNSFDCFPMDEIAPELLKMIVESCVSKKNKLKLKATLETFKKSPSESNKSQ